MADNLLSLFLPDDRASFKIEDANKYKSILNSMQEFGYQGRPILAYMDKGQAKALTGSHRLYAARNAAKYHNQFPDIK